MRENVECKWAKVLWHMQAICTGNHLETHKIKSRKFRNGLIIVCAVRGENFKYERSFREQLMDEEVEIQAEKLHRNSLKLFENQ